nr:hypothetical protein GCM10020092_093850 [Actinoplanes digitatis]
MAAHPGGEVVDAVEVLELVGLGLAPLHAVEQRELAVQQGLAAPGDVEEDLVDTAPDVGLLDRRLHGRALHLVERAAELADLVAAVLHGRGLDLDVDRLAALQSPDDRRQPLGGHLQRLAAQPGQAPDHRAADAQRHHDRDDDRDQAEQARPARAG